MMNTLSSPLTHTTSVKNNVNLTIQTDRENSALSNLFSDALASSTANLTHSQTLGQLNATQSNLSSLSNQTLVHSKNGSNQSNLLDASISQDEQATIDQAQQARKSLETKKNETKSHAQSNENKTHAATTANTDSALANAQALQANAAKTDPIQASTLDNDSMKIGIDGEAKGLSVAQQAFLSGQSSDGLAKGLSSNPSEISEADVMRGAFSQTFSPQLQNSEPISAHSIVSDGLSSVGSSTSLKSVSALSSAHPIPSEDLVFTEGLQNENGTSALENNQSMKPAFANASLNIAPALGEGPWAAALGQQALFIAKNQMGTAQLTLNPEHLGPIQITLDLKHDQASAVFVSPHEAVRQAIEASLPQLRDMFTQAGLQLGQTQVQSDLSGHLAQFSGQGQDQTSGRNGSRPSSDTNSERVHSTSLISPHTLTRATSGLLDTFA